MANTEPAFATTLRAIIVDDEERARRSLETLLAQHCPNVQVVSQSHNVPKAVLDIKQHQPDVVFLDIEMPEFNGFELFNFFDDINFEIIFATAYSDYAIKAFEFSAVDYLLKPVQVDKLKAAVEKVQNRLQSSNIKQRIDALRHNVQSDEFTKIALPVTDGLLFVEVNKIVMLQAEGGYTHVFLADGSKLLVSKKLLFFEEMLDKRRNFYRIHRSHLINLNYVKKYSRIESYIEMDNGVSMPVSKERKKDFEQSLSEIRVRKL